MRQFVTRGIVLARTDFGESDRILTILTQDRGKIRALAKGVRKVKSKLAAGIELFSISQITFILGKGDINTLTSTRLDQHFGNIVKDINRTMFAYDVLKKINRNTEDNTDSDYFELLKVCLKSIDKSNLSIELIHFWLNLQLLKLAGHTPNLKVDLNGQKLDQSKTYNFDFSNICFAENSRGKFNQNHIKLLRLGIELDKPDKLNKIQDIDAILPSSLQLTKLIEKQFTN